LVAYRLKFGERLFGDVEAQSAVGRGDPDITREIDGGGAGGARHGLRRRVERDLLGLRVDLGEAAVAALDRRARVEPQIAVLVAYDPMAAGGKALDVGHAELLHRPGLGVDLRHGGVVARQTVGDPQVTIEIGLHVVYPDHTVEIGRRAEHPVAAVIRGLRRAIARLLRKVVLLEHHARGLALRPFRQRDLHRAFARAAGAGEIGRQLLLVEVDVGRALV